MRYATYLILSALLHTNLQASQALLPDDEASRDENETRVIKPLIQYSRERLLEIGKDYIHQEISEDLFKVLKDMGILKQDKPN